MKNIRRVVAPCCVVLACIATCGQANGETLKDVRDLSSSSQSVSDQTLANQRLEIDADVLSAEGHYVAAIEKYQKLDLHIARIVNKLGVAYERLGSLQIARTNYETAIKLDPKLSSAYNNLATIYYAEHKEKKAEDLYKKSIHLDPKNASAFKNLGTSYFVRKKYRKGSEAYEEAIRLDPDTFNHEGINVAPFDKSLLAEMNYYLAELCAKNGQMESALLHLNRAIAEGFNDQRRLDNDAALAPIRQMPAFNARLK